MLKSLAIGAGHAATGKGACGAVGYINESDEATTDLILAIGAELLDVSIDTMCDMVHK